MQKHYITTTKSARYFTLGECTVNTKEIWVLLHGYAQNADDFLESFKGLEDEATFLIAPEGLHHFYWKDFSSNPVSSWMTKMDREKEIEDIDNYMTMLHKQLIEPMQHKGCVINYLGFSQGAPVLTRWISNACIEYDRLVLLAGEPAKDISYANSNSCFAQKGIEFVYGDKDVFVTEKRVSAFQNQMHKENVNFNVYTFEGRHEVNAAVIQLLKNKSL